ncbi:hypothetical protein [Bilifractor sp. HCP3S3_D3]|uniref:hypothetical protein n=1 Tax=Bilifractor sp. HCP3S3_D3 TaxID=3438907 RepID=UPI003F89688D
MDVKTILQEYKSYTPKAHGGSISSLNMADLCHRKRLYTEAMVIRKKAASIIAS